MARHLSIGGAPPTLAFSRPLHLQILHLQRVCSPGGLPLHAPVEERLQSRTLFNALPNSRPKPSFSTDSEKRPHHQHRPFPFLEPSPNRSKSKGRLCVASTEVDSGSCPGSDPLGAGFKLTLSNRTVLSLVSRALSQALFGRKPFCKMTSKSTVSYAERAVNHSNPLAKKIFEIAERKKTNVVLSADLRTTDELLHIADSK